MVDDLCQPRPTGRSAAVYQVLLWLDGICYADQSPDVRYAIDALTTEELVALVERNDNSRIVKLWAQLLREWNLIISKDMLARGVPLPPTPTRKRKARRTPHGLQGKQKSPEHRAKLAAANRGKVRGPLPPETRAKIATGNRGKPKSGAHCEALSKAHMGKPWSDAQREGRKRVRLRKVAV
jgi:hypothetical protein